MDPTDILIVLLGIVALGLMALLLRRPAPVGAPPALDQAALMEAVRNTVDVQVRDSTQALLANASAQGELLHNARSAAMNADAKNLLDPVSAQMGELRATVAALQNTYEQSRGEAQGINTNLNQRLQELTGITTELHGVLKSSTARGAWGEQQLRNIVELAGMLPYCDFEEQVHVVNEELRQRPDLVVRLANAGSIAVDSNCPQYFLCCSTLTRSLPASACFFNSTRYRASLSLAAWARK